MKINVVKMLGIVAIAGSVSLVGCDKPDGVGQSTGAAIDKATDKTVDAANTAADKTVEAANTVADKTVDVAKKTAAATKEATVKAVDKAGDVMVQAGTAMQNTDSTTQN